MTFIFVCSPGRSGTKFLSEIFKNYTDLKSFHGGEQYISNIINTGYYRNSNDFNHQIVRQRLKMIQFYRNKFGYFESNQIFIHKLVQNLINNSDFKPLYVINLIRNPIEVAISYENRNSYPSNNKCLWRLPINDSTRLLKINRKLTIFQENLIDWIDTQMKFKKYESYFDKKYVFKFENINNKSKIVALMKYFDIQIKKDINLSNLIKNKNKKETIITARHKKETKELINYLQTLDNYPKEIIDTYFIGYF